MLTEIPLHVNSVRAVAELNTLLNEHRTQQSASRAAAAGPQPSPATGLLMESIQVAGHQAAIEDGVIKHSVTGATANGVPAPMDPSPPLTNLRRGKWTAEEEEYASRLIAEFKMGTLPLTDGTTLRTFLSKLLNCDPMRISKKFVGNNSIGKQIFRRNYFDGADQDQVDLRMEQTKRELSELERRFLEKVAETNMKMCTKYEDIQEMGSSESPPGRTAPSAGVASVPAIPRDWLDPWMKPPTQGGGDGVTRTTSLSSASAEEAAEAAGNGAYAAPVINSLSDKSAAAGAVFTATASIMPHKREGGGVAPAVTMPFTLAQMHAAAEQNGVMDKNKKRVRQRRRSNSSVSVSSDTSTGAKGGVRNSPRRNDGDFQMPTHPMYSSFGGDWVAANRGPSPHDPRNHGGHKMNTPHYEEHGGGMKRVSSLDLLCASGMGNGELNEWSFGHGMQDWSSLSHSLARSGSDSHKKRPRGRGASFGQGSDAGSEDGRYVDDDSSRSINSQAMQQSDSTADLMSLLGQVSTRAAGSHNNMAEEYNHDSSTPFSVAGLQVFAGNRARTISGQSYDGSDFGMSYSPRGSLTENEYTGRDSGRGLNISGSAVFHSGDMSMDVAPQSVEVSPLPVTHHAPAPVNFKAEGSSGHDFVWSADFSEEVGDGSHKRVAALGELGGGRA